MISDDEPEIIVISDDDLPGLSSSHYRLYQSQLGHVHVDKKFTSHQRKKTICPKVYNDLVMVNGAKFQKSQPCRIPQDLSDKWRNLTTYKYIK